MKFEDFIAVHMKNPHPETKNCEKCYQNKKILDFQKKKINLDILHIQAIDYLFAYLNDHQREGFSLSENVMTYRMSDPTKSNPVEHCALTTTLDNLHSFFLELD